MKRATAEAVVDASAMAAVLFGEDGAEDALARIKGFDLIAPQLLPFELANVAVMKARREPAAADSIRIGFDSFESFGVVLAPVDRRDVARVAAAENLTAYDAAYLVLASARGVPLVTFDRALAAAARRLTPRV